MARKKNFYVGYDLERLENRFIWASGAKLNPHLLMVGKVPRSVRVGFRREAEPPPAEGGQRSCRSVHIGFRCKAEPPPADGASGV